MEKIALIKFGFFDPYFIDTKMSKLFDEFRKSEQYKQIVRLQKELFVEKYNFLRNFFDAEEIYRELQFVNDEFRIKCMQEQRKVYYDTNKEKINQQQREAYARNKEKHHEREKEYRETHKEQINEKNRRYQQSHKEEIKAKKSEKVTCECGAVIARNSITEHKKSNRHYFKLNF